MFEMPPSISILCYYCENSVVQVRSAASDQFNRLCKDVSISGGGNHANIIYKRSCDLFTAGQTLNTDPSQVKRSTW